jgi:Acetyltransferase (GNAT) domain
MIEHKPYFLQTEPWARFWKEVNPAGHNYFWYTTQIGDYKLSTLIYDFPWFLGESFWYLPKFGILTGIGGDINKWSQIDKAALSNLLQKHLSEILSNASKKQKSFVKCDLDDGLANALEIQTPLELAQYLNSFQKQKAVISPKKIQYLQTITLNLASVPKQTESENNENFDIENFAAKDLSSYFEKSQEFWKTTNSNIRRYTKKVIDLEWKISISKSTQNFEDFWNVYNQTKDRQGFIIHPKSYVKALFDKPDSYIIVLKDSAGTPHCVWFGMKWNDALIYLYGGNTDYSFANYGQYLMHLTACFLATKLGLDYYDLGGYEPNTGYGKFKESYKAELRTFVGPIDIILKPIQYTSINTAVNIAKSLKKLLKK